MSYETSMIYTMGTALSRALEDHSEVSILVEGMWLTGNVVVHDGVGVVLDNGSDHSVVKVDRIGAVRINQRLPWHAGEISDGAADAPLHPYGASEAMPMPGPRPPAES